MIKAIINFPPPSPPQPPWAAKKRGCPERSRQIGRIRNPVPPIEDCFLAWPGDEADHRAAEHAADTEDGDHPGPDEGDGVVVHTAGRRRRVAVRSGGDIGRLVVRTPGDPVLDKLAKQMKKVSDRKSKERIGDHFFLRKSFSIVESFSIPPSGKTDDIFTFIKTKTKQ